MKKSDVNDCSLAKLPKFSDERGSLTFVEGQNHIPFTIKRIFYLYDIKPGEKRGAHAHKALHQFLISINGSFSIELKDGVRERCVLLDSPSQGLHIPPGIWAEESNFSNGAVCLVLASDKFLESDYLRSYADFLEFKKDH
jgi:dTDP-4-dehydrorhamnose 3,5-epimerase-like enzyme